MTATASVTVTAMKTTARMIVILPAVRELLFFKNTKSVLNGHSRPDVMTKPDHIANVPSPLKLLNAIKSELGSLLICFDFNKALSYRNFTAAIIRPPRLPDF